MKLAVVDGFGNASLAVRLAVLVTFVSCPCPTFAQTTAQARDVAQQRIVVVRIAGTLLEETVNRDIHLDFPVETQLLDAWCEGSGTASGKIVMDFAGAKLEELRKG